MITLIGVLVILAAVTMALVTNLITLREEDVAADGPYGAPKNAHPPLLTNWSGFKTAGYTLLGIAIIGVNGLFFINPAGTATAVQYLTGGDNAVTSQGVKMKWWGRTIPISFEIAMQDIMPDKNGMFPDEEGIYFRKAQRREFSDAIKADISASLIVSVNYQDHDLFLDMADKNRSEQKLVYARILPVYDQALKNTCKLMDAQDYISGASSQFDYYLKDQMEHGMYLTKEVYEADIKKEVIGNDSSSQKTVASGVINEKNKQKKYVIKTYPKGHKKAGDPMRDASNSLKRYGLTVVQAAVTNIDWEGSFDKRLDLQKDQVAQTQLEKQQAEKEFYATKKAVAQGEREKAEVRVKYEKLQLEKTIAAETKAKEAKYKEQEEVNLLAAARKAAERRRVTADAKAYEIRKNVAAGITPETRLKIDWEGKAKVMAEAAKMVGPQVVIQSGGSKGGDGNLTNALIQADMAKRIFDTKGK